MKFKHVALFVCGLALAAAQTGGKQEPSLQKAIQTEMVDGDLKAAIKQYGDIVAKYGKSDRGVAAAALLRMAECYAKLSDAEARKIFERVVHEYADQKDAVEIARLRLDTPVRPPTLNNRRIWASSEISHPSRPSADGRYMSYIGENGNLTIYNFGTGESRLLTNKKSWSESHSQATYSIPSHDGKHIAYVWYDADSSKEGLYEIRIASLGNSDGQHRVVFRTNSEIPRVVLDDWSSDGRNLLAILSRAGGGQQIAVIPAAGGSVRVLKSLDWRYPGRMRFSPNGRYVAYSLAPNTNSRKRDIFVLRTDGGHEARVIDHPSDDFVLGWTPGGRGILFASDRTGAVDAWLIPVEDGKSQGPPELIKKNIGTIFPLGFTEKGAFFYQTSGGVHEALTADLDTTWKLAGAPVAVTKRVTGSTEGAAWSPDGKYLAYGTGQRQDLPKVWIRSVETGDEKEFSLKLNYIDAYDGLRWFPDSRALLFRGSDTKGSSDIFRMDIQRGEVTSLGLAGGVGWVAGPPEISPDGNTVFYRRVSDENWNHVAIVKRDLRTGDEREIHRLPRTSWGQLALSPDSRRLAFGLFDANNRSASLMVIPAEGGPSRELYRGAIFPPAALLWTPDASRLIFGVVEKGGSEQEMRSLYSIAANGGEPENLGAPAPELHGVRIHPHERRIAFTAGARSLEIWVLENFLPTLSAKR